MNHILKGLCFITSTSLFFSCTDNTPPKVIPLMPTDAKDDYSAIYALPLRSQWGAANVHDPSVIKVDSFYYVYSTDAYYVPYGGNLNPENIETGHIQVRRSRDLVNWEFIGWAFPSIPADAVEYIHSLTGGKGADGIWAPYIVKVGDLFRLYYSVSSFGANTSYIGMAQSTKPTGPWEQKGCVVKTNPQSPMNAIDPTVTTDADGKMWMIYGSYFAGIYCVELDQHTGLPVKNGDQGHLVATRSHKSERIIEAPEIIYNAELKKYFLFVSYDPLFTHYNIRVGRSDSPQGPFLDMFGNDMSDTTDNYPILTHSYQFEGHPGWSGNGHCGVLNDNGRFFLFHQGRLGPDNLMIVMQVREIKWLPSGWPVVSPERYAGIPPREIKAKELAGDWEIIELKAIPDHVTLWQGQIPMGGWTYGPKEYNISERHTFHLDNTTTIKNMGTWQFKGDKLLLGTASCLVFQGWDWENQKPTILFTGILENGSSIWGKKVYLTDK